jgi:hypothetical protein
MKKKLHKLALGVIGLCMGSALSSQVLINSNFASSADGFTYSDNTFKSTTQSAYASGVYGSAALNVTLGGVDNVAVGGMSGGWSRTFNLAAPSLVRVKFKFKMTQTGEFEQSDITEALASVDGVLLGNSRSFVDQVKGDGDTGPTIGSNQFFTFTKVIGPLAAGSHTLTLGGHLNAKNNINEVASLSFDDVEVLGVGNACASPDSSDASKILKLLNLSQYKTDIDNIASFGDRSQLNSGINQGYQNAEAWLVTQLQNMGYTVEFNNYTFLSTARRSAYVTKIGTVSPQNMYIVSAHFDGRGGGAAYNDDASGSSLVLQIARLLSNPNVKSDVSIRMIFWNNEESGLNGSAGYAGSRASLRGIENPVGSGKYPEPNWLGVIQHDKVLWDHGLPSGATQIVGADVDIEFQASSTFSTQSAALAQLVKNGNIDYATTYPSEVSNNMDNTDSKSFQNLCPSVSVRENRRVAEIGFGSDPNWHQPSDVASTYVAADINLGFNAMQTTLGFLANNAGLRLTGNTCNLFLDTDLDGIADNIDNCKTIFNSNQEDADLDGVGDACDACPALANSLIGASCDDGNACTTNDKYSTACNCAGVLVDADSDGVCAANDPNDNNACIPNATSPSCNTCTVQIDEGFEASYGATVDGGTDCNRSNSNAKTGVWSVQLRGNTTSSRLRTNSLDFTGAASAKVSYSIIATGMENGETFRLEVSTNGGTSYTLIKNYVFGTSHFNNTRYNEEIVVNTLALTSTTRVRLRLAGSDNTDLIYIDDFKVEKCNSAVAGSILASNRSEPKNFEISPNPTTGFINVNLGEFVGSDVKIEVFSVTGQLMTSQLVADKSINQIEMNINNLSDGVYLIKASNGEVAKSKKVVLQKN